MSNLYNDLATIYDKMYQTFIDYEAEYHFYNQIIETNKKTTVLEIGSGTGHLAKYFQATNFDYLGLDYSVEMIEIAKNRVPNVAFLQGDMRHFFLKKPIESVIITARTISYLLTNKDVINAFSSIYNNLKPTGILCFDFIDANEFIPNIAKGEEVTHKASFDGEVYFRESFWQANLENGMDFKRDSVYYKKENERQIKIGEDNAIIRTFTLDEIKIFLTITNFKIKNIIKRPSYAFPTYVIMAEKWPPADFVPSTRDRF
jgi:SAM-dependent methyltransferase